jgi:hypothetical protein
MPMDRDKIARIANALSGSAATIVLGAGASLDPANDPKSDWTPTILNMPSGGQLNSWLARLGKMPQSDRLSLTAQYVETFEGESRVRNAINEIFSRPIDPLLAHTFCASFAKWRRDRRDADAGSERFRFPLFITTNYDDLLEQAFATEHIEFDLLSYDELPPNQEVALFHTEYRNETGKLSRPKRIRNNLKYSAVSTKQRTCIVKIHGSACRPALRSGQPAGTPS